MVEFCMPSLIVQCIQTYRVLQFVLSRQEGCHPSGRSYEQGGGQHWNVTGQC